MSQEVNSVSPAVHLVSSRRRCPEVDGLPIAGGFFVEKEGISDTEGVLLNSTVQTMTSLLLSTHLSARAPLALPISH